MSEEKSHVGAGEPELSVRAELDVPGETGRQARVFAIWLVCLLLAVATASLVHTRATGRDGSRTDTEDPDLTASRAGRLRVAVLVGLLLPGLLTWALTHHRRRGGGHARGIVVDVTSEGELRLWGRGYGTRLPLAGAEVTERLVDVYAGRLGSFRERRLRVRAAAGGRAPGTSSEIELATLSVPSDGSGEGLRLDGGEGDCVELGRDDFELVRARVLELARRPPG